LVADNASRLTLTRRTRLSSVDAAQQKDGFVCCVALTGTKHLQWNFTPERIYDSNAATANVGGCDASNTNGAIKARTRARTLEMPAKLTPGASSEMVKLIRKLRWVGLEEKAEQLEKKLEQQPATDTVLAIQSETD
jgi:hypothetical protein